MSSAATLLGALLIAGFAREGPFPFQRAVFDPRQIGQAVRNRAVLLASLGYFGHMWELYAMWGWFLVYTRAALSAQGAAAGAMASLLTFCVIAVGAGRLRAGRLDVRQLGPNGDDDGDDDRLRAPVPS